MSALTRCTRYARIFNRSLHSYSRNVARLLQKSETNTLGTHTKSFCPRPDSVSKRLCTATSAETTKEQVDVSKESRRRLQESRKNFKHSEDYPASTFWKKYDYSKIRKLNDFHSACKNIYFAMVSQKGISAAEFHDFMSLVEQRDDFTDDEVKLVLRTVGFLNKEVRGAEKARWTEYLTRRFISLGVPLDVTYYNQVLRNFLQMNHPFSPVEFMSTMEKQGVAPNGVTLSRFVVAYCKMGDIKSASQVLEHMRSREMSINARVYNNLILGNFIAGDKDTAMQLFRDAPEMGFTMDASVYHAAIVGHAIIGDLDGVKELFKEANENMVVFSDGAYSTMIEQVAPKARQDVVEYFLELLTKASTFYYNESLDTLPVLIEQGNYDLAYKYFRGLNDPSARLFYKAALLANMGPEDIAKYHRQMKADSIRDSSILEFFGLAVIKYFYEPAVGILPHIKAQGETLRPHMLWPLIQYYKIMNNLDGLKKILPYLSPADGGKTVQLFLEPAMGTFMVTKEEYRDMLKEHSVLSEGQINACMIHLHLQEGWRSAAEYAKTCGQVEDLAGEGLHLLGGRLIQSASDSNWKHVVEVLASLQNCSQGIENAVIRNVLRSCTDMQDVKQVMLEKGVKVNESVLPQEFKALFSEQELNKVTRKKFTFDQMKEMSLKGLLEMESNFSTSIVYKACILEKSYRAKKWDIYKRILQTVDITKLFMPNVIFSAARFYSQYPADVSNCLKVFGHLQSEFPSFTPNMSPMLSIASGICEAGRHEDAVNILSKYNYNDSDMEDAVFVNTKHFFSMEQVPENTKLAGEMLETLSNNGYLRRLRHILLNYWKFVSSCGDFKVIIEAFEMLKMQHNYVPHDFGIVFGHFIRKGDKPSLQTAYDKFTDVVMEQSVLLSLAAAFLENGQIENARKTLQTPGMRVIADNFRSICQRWATEGKSELIDEFTKLVGILPGQVKKSEMTLINLRAMCNKPKPDVDAVIKYFESRFDEEDLEVNVDACRLYANFLREHKREVPFDKFTLEFISENRQQRNLHQSEQRRNAEQTREERKNKRTQLEPEHKTENIQLDEQAKPEKIDPQSEELERKETTQNIKDSKVNAEKFKNALSQEGFVQALRICRNLSTEEIAQLLPEDLPLLTKWAEFLMNRYHVRELECIPSESLKQILNGQLDVKEGEKLSWNCQKWRYILEKEQDLLLSCIPKMHIVDQTQCFVASLFSNDKDRVEGVKKLIEASERPNFVREVVQRMRNRQANQDFKVDSDKSKKREMYFTLMDSIKVEEAKAYAVSYTFKHLIQTNDVNGVDLLSEKTASNGWTFETVAERLSTKAARNLFISDVQKLEEQFKSQSKSFSWEPSCNWSVKIEPVEAQTKVTDITTQMAVTDIATEIEDKTEVAVAKETPVDVTVAVKDKTEVISVDKDAEVITDSAKTVSGEAELEMKDKASVISDDSSELGSKSEVEKKTS